MIASHDSYTFLKAKNPLMSLITIWWRCQKLNIEAQYKLGTRIFDIRVYYNRKKKKWGTAHGFAKSDKIMFDSIPDICKYFNKNFPNSIIRIYLEDNVKKNKNQDIKEKFLNEAQCAYIDYINMIWEIGTHYPWITYFRGQNDFIINEYYCHLFNWNPDKKILDNIKKFNWSSWNLPLFAKKHNPIITQKMIEDKSIMYIIDYIGIYPK